MMASSWPLPTADLVLYGVLCAFLAFRVQQHRFPWLQQLLKRLDFPVLAVGSAVLQQKAQSRRNISP